MKHCLPILFAIVACAPIDDASTKTSGLTLGYDSPISLAAGRNDNVAPPQGSILQVTPHASGSQISGIDSSSANQGDVFWIQNLSTTIPVTLLQDNSNSTAAYRFHFPQSQNIVIPPWRSVAIEYALYASGGWLAMADVGVSNIVATSTPSRSLGTAFQPSTTYTTAVYYSARVSAPLSLAGGAVGRIELLSDSANPPTTVRGRVAAGESGTVVVGISMAGVSEGQLHYIVPVGDYVLLQSVTESGSPTYTITTQTEQSM